MIEKGKELFNNKKFTCFLYVFCAAFVLLYYLRKVQYIYVVWELVDEYGYLANAAYLSGTEWEWLTNSYYGYGYSLLLVPLFWIYDTGIEIIRGAIAINAFCMLGLFSVQYALLSKLFKKVNRNIIVLISATMCFYPYLVSFQMKVLPECFLTVLIWLCGLLFYKAQETEKCYYYILLAFCTVYTFFVHTRAMVFCVVIISMLLIMILQKKVKLKNIIVFGVCAIIFFVLGFLLKNQIIDAVYGNEVFGNVSSTDSTGKVIVGNTVTISYMVKRILKLVTNLKVWPLYSIACKSFYLFVGTAGMFHLGLYSIGKSAWQQIHEKKAVDTECVIKLGYAITFVLMIVAVIVQSPGKFKLTAYFFYSRYYEYLIGPIVAMGIIYCIKNGLKLKENFFLLSVLFISGWGTFALAEHLETQEFSFDSSRMAAFSFVLNFFDEYRDAIVVMFVLVLALFIIILILNQRTKIRSSAMFIVVLNFCLSNIVLTDKIVFLNGTNKDDYVVAEYIHDNYDAEEVYFVNRDSVVVTAYASVQSLLGKEKLNVIKHEDMDLLETGDLVVTFSYNPYLEQLEKELLVATPYYGLYEVK